MMSFFEKDKRAQLVLLLYVIFILWWLLVHYFWSSNYFDLQLFAATYGIVALLGGYWGLKTSKRWGGDKSYMGKSILFFSLGLLAQEFGQLSYSYYIFFRHVDVPYPSIGDIGYFISIPLYIAGIVYLAQASGVRLRLKNILPVLQAILLPMVILLFSYVYFLRDYSIDMNNLKPLTIFLDFAYPLGQATYVSLALVTYLLVGKILGGVMRNRILLILFALVIQYSADYMFLYQARNGGWFAGGLNDVLYLSAYFMMTISLLSLDGVIGKLKSA